MRILSVVGARPNFMKIAPIMREIRRHKMIKHCLVHTGQHYDHAMSGSFFKDLGIPRPDVNLNAGSGSHAKQTGEIMIKLEKCILDFKPDVVLVVGDVNSTLAASIVASKLCVPVAHVEAGLRSRDRSMPEEINRLVTDSIADILFTTSLDADRNLLKEGAPRPRIHFVGNVMIDTLIANAERAKQSAIMKRLKIAKQNFALVTLHRPANVDSKENLRNIIAALKEIQKDIKVVFPIHPRTRKNLADFVSSNELKAMPQVLLTDPLGYLDFLHLMQNASFVVTDSGGIQEETTVLGVPCLTVRENTERPITLTQGTNTLVGLNKTKIIREAKKIIEGKAKKGRKPKFWDGQASRRIVRKLLEFYKQKKLRRDA